MKQINVAVIGTGWCGGIRAETCAMNPLVNDLHVVETRPERLAEISAKTRAKTATADYRDIIKRDDIEAVLISATPGPNVLYVTTRSIRFGFAAAMFGMLGCLCALAVILSASVAGVSAFMLAVPAAFEALKYAGAA